MSGVVVAEGVCCDLVHRPTIVLIDSSQENYANHTGTRTGKYYFELPTCRTIQSCVSCYTLALEFVDQIGAYATIQAWKILTFIDI